MYMIKIVLSNILQIVGHSDGIVCLNLLVGNKAVLCNPALRGSQASSQLIKSCVLPDVNDVDVWD